MCVGVGTRNGEGGREAVLPLVPTHGSRMRVRDKPRR